MKRLLLINLLLFYNFNLIGQSLDCSDKPTIEKKFFDLNEDDQIDLVELITCRKEGIPNLKICVYYKNKLTNENNLIKEISGRDLEGYTRPEIILSKGLIKVKMFIDTRFEPMGVEHVGVESSYYLKAIGANWTYYGSSSISYNQKGGIESISLRKGNIANPPFTSEGEVFDSQQIPRQLLDSLDFYHKVFNEENKTKKYIKTLSYSELETMGFVNFDLINIQTVQQLNDIGYFLIEAKQFDQAIYLLQRVKDEFPNRTVVYLNLGDAYYGAKMKRNSKEAYTRYIDLMKKSGKEAKIPQKVLERVK